MGTQKGLRPLALAQRFPDSQTSLPVAFDAHQTVDGNIVSSGGWIAFSAIPSWKTNYPAALWDQSGVSQRFCASGPRFFRRHNFFRKTQNRFDFGDVTL